MLGVYESFGNKLKAFYVDEISNGVRIILAVRQDSFEVSKLLN